MMKRTFLTVALAIALVHTLMWWRLPAHKEAAFKARLNEAVEHFRADPDTHTPQGDWEAAVIRHLRELRDIHVEFGKPYPQEWDERIARYERRGQGQKKQ